MTRSSSHGTGSAPGLRTAPDRWSVSLGGAGEVKDRVGAGEGLLELPGPGGACLAAAPSGVGAGGSGDGAGFHAAGSPESRREPLSARLRSRTGFRAGALVAVLALALGGFFWRQAAGGTTEAFPAGEEPAPAAQQQPAEGGDGTAGQAGPVTGQGTIIVHVAGAVAAPGVVQLVPGSRLHEAIAAAGGGTAAADPGRLNLASVLEDGQKILVPELGGPGPADPAPEEDADRTGGGTPAEGRKIDLNHAGVAELGTLPRVGPVLAQRIVDWRKEHGRFRTVEELDAVDGVGPKLLEALLPLVRV